MPEINALSAMERVSLITQSLHGLLQAKGDEDLARLAWAAHLDASTAAESLGKSLGLETVEA